MVFLLLRDDQQRIIVRQYTTYMELMNMNKIQLEKEAATFIKEISATCSHTT